jgi:hypothetical protein
MKFTVRHLLVFVFFCLGMVACGGVLKLNLSNSVFLPLINQGSNNTSTHLGKIPAPTATQFVRFTGDDPLKGLTINGIPVEQVVVLTDATIANIRQIYARGQALGNNPNAFSKIGDSTIESPFFMDRFDEGGYNLGDYAFLQLTIDHFTGSFARQGYAVRRGMHSWTLFDPMWADASCLANESPVTCEFREQRPSVVFIRLGSNDAGRMDLFDENMRKLIEYAIEQGIIPIIGTKADRNEGSNANNEKLRELAEDYDVPLWDFDLAAQTLPNHGLDSDGVHLTTFYAHDFALPEAMRRGYGVHTLTGLMMLYAVWRELP